MAFKFDARIAIALQFNKGNSRILGFEFHGVKDEEDDGDVATIQCNDEEAEAWGIYARLQNEDGSVELPHWIADLDQQAAAKALCDILNNIHEELKHNNKPERTPQFILDIIERKKGGADCTEEESAEIKEYLKETILMPGDGTSDIDRQIQSLFPQEYGDYLDETDISALPSVG